ncbi:coiled-coil domain-containing protein 27-like [Hypanus sabinus]|uniref:coiled-coil domain-containing protein 27-like n=1 Tax=Hypanus sabinus TaxID=79690 RepID=UPI0028C37783|nr:coiled-coil domain-containing protein 27-like [Hypanus sabinus]
MKGFLALQKREKQPPRVTLKKCDLIQSKAICESSITLEGATGKKVRIKNQDQGATLVTVYTHKNWIYRVPEKSDLTIASENTIFHTSGVQTPSNVVIQLDWSDETLRETSRNIIPWSVSMIHQQKCMELLEEKMELISTLKDESAEKDIQIATLQKEVENLTEKLPKLTEDGLKTEVLSLCPIRIQLEILKATQEESKQKDVIIADLRDQIWQLGLEIRLLRDDVGLAVLDMVTNDKEESNPLEQEVTKELPEASAVKSDEETKPESQGEQEESKSSSEEDEYRGSEGHLPSDSTESVSSVKSTDREEGESFTSEDEAVKVLVIRNTELEEKVKEMEESYNMSTGTLSTLIRKLSRAEDHLRNSEAVVAKLQKELSERCSQLQDMSSKFSSLREENTQIKVVADLQSENIKLSELVTRLQEEATGSTDTAVKLKEEVDKLQLHSCAEEARRRQLQEQCDSIKAENQTLRRNLQQQLVELQVTSARLEKFISRMVQAIYSAPGIEQPTTEITDEDTLQAFRKILDERLEFYGTLTAHEIPVRPLFTGNTEESEMAP